MSLRIPAAVIGATAAPVSQLPTSSSGPAQKLVLTALYKVAPIGATYWGELVGPTSVAAIHPQNRVLGREKMADLDESGRLVIIEEDGCPSPHWQAAHAAPISEAFRTLAPRLAALVYPLEEEADPVLSVSLSATGRIWESHLGLSEASVLVSLEEGTIIVLRLGLMALPGGPTTQGWSDTSGEEATSRHYDHLLQERPDELLSTRARALALTVQAFGSLGDPGRP
jgi:hypothetical protein